MPFRVALFESCQDGWERWLVEALCNGLRVEERVLCSQHRPRPLVTDVVDEALDPPKRVKWVHTQFFLEPRQQMRCAEMGGEAEVEELDAGELCPRQCHVAPNR